MPWNKQTLLHFIYRPFNLQWFIHNLCAVETIIHCIIVVYMFVCLPVCNVVFAFTCSDWALEIKARLASQYRCILTRSGIRNHFQTEFRTVLFSLANVGASIIPNMCSNVIFNSKKYARPDMNYTYPFTHTGAFFLTNLEPYAMGECRNAFAKCHHLVCGFVFAFKLVLLHQVACYPIPMNDSNGWRKVRGKRQTNCRKMHSKKKLKEKKKDGNIFIVQICSTV